MTRFSIAIVLAAACIPPAATSNSSSSEPSVTAGGGGGTCGGACARLVACGLVADAGACAQQCQIDGHGPDVLAQLAQGSCEEDAAWLQETYGGGTANGGGGGGGGGAAPATTTVMDGGSCTGGDGRCGNFSTCCGSSGPAAYGAPGMCQQVAICNMPRR